MADYQGSRCLESIVKTAPHRNSVNRLPHRGSRQESTPRRSTLSKALLLSSLFSLIPLLPRQAPAEAYDTHDVIAGFHIGISDHRNEEHFRKYEVFVDIELPWAWRSRSGWILATQLDLTCGVLDAGGDAGFLASAGPGLSLRREGGRLTLDLGISPAYLGRSHYGKEDLSGHLQFLSHIGLSCRIFRGMNLAYRFQHMSNADIEQPNPGLNLHLFELNYRF